MSGSICAISTSSTRVVFVGLDIDGQYIFVGKVIHNG